MTRKASARVGVGGDRLIVLGVLALGGFMIATTFVVLSALPAGASLSWENLGFLAITATIGSGLLLVAWLTLATTGATIVVVDSRLIEDVLRMADEGVLSMGASQRRGYSRLLWRRVCTLRVAPAAPTSDDPPHTLAFYETRASRRHSSGGPTRALLMVWRPGPLQMPSGMAPLDQAIDARIITRLV